MKSPSENESNVKLQIEAFTKAICECEEYCSFMQCNEDLENNPDAKNLLQRYQIKLEELQWSGYDAKTIDELKEVRTQVMNNETLTKLFSSQELLIALLKSSNDLISEKIGEPFAQRQQGGCC